MYLAIFGFAAYILYIEHVDIHCPSLTADKKRCDDEGGMAYSGSKPSEGDSCKTLLEKVGKSGTVEQRSIKWRLAFLLSVGIMIPMWVLVGTPGSLPDWKTFYLSCLVGFLVVLGKFIYYSYHIYGDAANWFRDGVGLLEKKCVG